MIHPHNLHYWNKYAIVTNSEERITNKGRNLWDAGFMQDYQTVAHIEILPKVPVYPPRPTVSFCNEAATPHMFSQKVQYYLDSTGLHVHMCCLGIPGQNYWKISIEQHMTALQQAPYFEVMAWNRRVLTYWNIFKWMMLLELAPTYMHTRTHSWEVQFFEINLKHFLTLAWQWFRSCFNWLLGCLIKIPFREFNSIVSDRKHVMVNIARVG